MEELKGIQQDTPLSCAFFSNRNINSLQVNIRYSVWRESNKEYVIGNQDVTELKIIMRSIYLQNSVNQPNNILDQVRDLNKLVLDYAVRQIITQVRQSVSYNKDITEPRHIIPHSENTSIRGSRQLEQKPW